MEVLLALTTYAKQYGCRKDMLYTLRQWYLWTAIELCLRAHRQGYHKDCPRCEWICNVNRQLPSRWARKFLKQWYQT